MTKSLKKNDCDKILDTVQQYKQAHNYIEAIELLQKSIYHTDTCNLEYTIKLQAELADLYFIINDYKNSFEIYLEALNNALNNKLYDLSFDLYYIIGRKQLNLWQFKKAIELYEQALNLAERIKNKEKIIEYYINVGNIYNWDEQLDKAFSFLDKAMQQETAIKDNIALTRLYASYAILQRKLKQFEIAESFFIKSIAIAEQYQLDLLIDIKKSYGIMLLDIQQYEEAEEMLLSSIIYIDNTKQKHKKDPSNAAIFEALIKLYKATNKLEQALLFYDKLYECKIELMEKGYSQSNNVFLAKIGLENARKEKQFAQEKAELKSVFIASISHEIRTPINIILGASDLLSQSNPSEQQQPYINVLQNSGKKLSSLINDILDISKIEAGKFEIINDKIHLDKLLDNIKNAFIAVHQNKAVQLKFKINDDVPLVIQGDENRLEQVITNLISNSLKFTIKGNITTTIKQKNEQLIIQIKDTGIGIPKNNLNNIFDHYEQVKNKEQRKYKGTGLGLSIVKKLVELMHGNIQVKSKVDVGTTFTIQLPLIEIDAIATQTENINDLAFLKNKKILIVDDTEENRFITINTLIINENSIHCFEAENGKVCIDFLQKNKHHIDLIIMDLDMPIMNGFEAAAFIKNDKQLKHHKILGTTASLITESDFDYQSLGFDAFIPKPFNNNELLEVLKKVLSK
ncbi:MAG: tetratricopeptide repeat protein [Chitinophagales bacterium]|nr:tetratricopeptide repeat protein [Chitinophagales bacterium]